MEAQDYSAFEEDNSNQMEQLQELADRQIAAEEALAEAEELVAQRKKELAVIAEGELPELMDTFGIEEFKLRTGQKIKVAEALRTSIPKKNEALAFEWIRQQGSGKMIKREIKVPFAMGQDDDAAKLAKELEKRGLEPSDKTFVAPATLKAFIKRRLESGEELPVDLFSIFRQRLTKISG